MTYYAKFYEAAFLCGVMAGSMTRTGLLGYTTTMPQPTDAYTSGIFWMTLAIKYGLPMLGWLITLMAMLGCPLTKEEMVNVQKRIADKKDALRHEVIAEHMQ